MVAMALVLLMAVVGLALDVGYHRYEQRLQQSAADSAALAGAAEITFGDVKAAAQKDATSNGYTDNTGGATCTAAMTCVQVDHGPLSGANSGNTDAVEVIISKSYPTFFERVFNASVPITTRAVAKLVATDANCLYLLDTGGSTNYNNMTFNGPKCGIIDNESGSPNMHGANMNAGSITYAGSAPNTNAAHFTGASPTQGLPASDPCPSIPGCAYLKNNPPSTNPCSATFTFNGSNAPLPNVCYGSMDLGKGTVNLSPGLYVLNGQLNANQATLNGSNVTFYIGPSGTLNLNKATLNVSAPTSGNYSGVLFYQIPSNTNDPNFNKATSDALTGLLYFPTSSVNFNKTGGGYTVLVFGSANFNSNTMNFADPPSGQTLIQQAVLAE